MPGRNVVKLDIPDSYYHVYARGSSHRKVFRDDDDYCVFLNLFKRYLSKIEISDKSGRKYPHLHNQIELLAYCLMGNHFHLLFYQKNQGAMSNLMHGIMTSYSVYYNKKYKCSGALFETRYRASRISSDEYLMQVSRYIHLNPGNWQAYPYSSIHAYFGIGKSEWLRPEKVIDLFGSTPVYADFLDDSDDYKKSLDEIADELANKA